jgi:hypothetical protein
MGRECGTQSGVTHDVRVGKNALFYAMGFHVYSVKYLMKFVSHTHFTVFLCSKMSQNRNSICCLVKTESCQNSD